MKQETSKAQMAISNYCQRMIRIVSILPLVAAIGLGAASHWFGTLLGCQGTLCTTCVRSEYGRLFFDVYWSDPGTRPRWLLDSWPHEPAWSSHLGGWWRYLGFDYAIGGTAGGNLVQRITVPYWFFAVLGAALPFAIRSGRRRRNRCAPDS